MIYGIHVNASVSVTAASRASGSIIVVVKYVTGVSHFRVLIFLLTAPRSVGSPGGTDKWVVISWRMPAGRWERRCHSADERLHRAAQNEGNSTRKCCVCVCAHVYVFCVKAFPNGACLEGLLRITGAAAFFLHTSFLFKAISLRFYKN